jgi:CRP-like cAMP-binding protein
MFVSFPSAIPHPHPLPEISSTLAGLELARTDVLYHLGDAAESVFRVEEGLLKLSIDLPSGKERIISVAGPGDFVGAVTPTHSAYLETAEALSPRVRVMAGAAGDAQLAPALHVAAGAHLSRLHDALHDADLSVPARLAQTFARLGERFGARLPDGTVQLTLPLTHDHLAAMIGAARETTTATLSALRDMGLISGTRGRYRFDPARLRTYAATAA